MDESVDTVGFSHIDFAALLRGDYNTLSGPGHTALLEMTLLKIAIDQEGIDCEEAKKRFPNLKKTQIDKVFEIDIK